MVLMRRTEMGVAQRAPSANTVLATQPAAVSVQQGIAVRLVACPQFCVAKGFMRATATAYVLRVILVLAVLAIALNAWPAKQVMNVATPPGAPSCVGMDTTL